VSPAAAGVFIPPWKDSVSDQEFPAQYWVLTEACWAGRLEAPPLRTMVAWAYKRVRWLFAGLRQGIEESRLELVRDIRSVSADPRMALFLQSVNASVIGILYGAAQILASILLVLLSVIARIPIEVVENFATARAKALLVDNVGDFYVCVYDRIQAAAIRQSVFEAITWLVRTAGCTRILVAAHSGGTVVALDALGPRDLPEGPQGSARTLENNIKKVTTVVTFGAALNLAWDEFGSLDQFKRPRLIPFWPLRRGTTWINFWTPYDWALGGRPLVLNLKTPSGQSMDLGVNAEIRVTNGLSPLTDHGGYIDNYEEFIARLAGYIDRPSDPDHSRFSDVDRRGASRRCENRSERVDMLIRWRFLAIATTLAVVVYRYGFQMRDHVADGSLTWGLTAQVPVVGWLVSIAGLLADRLAIAVSAVPPLAHLANALRELIMSFPVLLVVGLGMVLAYAVSIDALFTDWNLRMGRISARPAPHEDLTKTMRLRTAGYVLVLFSVSAAVVTAPQFADIPRDLGAVLGLR
jgi:hypothetical protein